MTNVERSLTVVTLFVAAEKLHQMVTLRYKKERLAIINYSLGLFSKDITKYFTRMQVPSNFWIFQDSEYSSDYEYVWVSNMPGFMI